MNSPLPLFVLLLGGFALPAAAVPQDRVDKPARRTAPPSPVAQPATPAEDAPPPIREFDVETIARLGRELHRVDQLAWVATDVLAAKVGFATYSKEGACGWVVETSGAEPVVRFLRKTGETIEAAYDIRFPATGSPVLEVPQDRVLTARQLARHVARDTALQPFSEGKYPLCRLRPGNHFNYAVLDDPDGDGFLVYLLRPKETNDEVPIGGHYRITVSADGRTVERVDALSRSCLTMNRKREIPEDGKLVSLGMNHVVSATPVETHVFLSLQEKLPFYVLTRDGTAWQVEGGMISRSYTASPAPAPESGKR